jgi:hydrogenase maturation factor
MTPGDAEPGDLVVCTKHLGFETLVTFSQTRRRLANRLFGRSRAERLRRQFRFQSCVKEALALSKLQDVHSMHDAAEGGLVAALNDMGRASGLGFRVDLAQLLVAKETRTLIQHFQLSTNELVSMSSSGTLVVAVRSDAGDRVLRHLSRMGVPARVIGTFTRRRERVLRDQSGDRAFPVEERDPFTRICY